MCGDFGRVVQGREVRDAPPPEGTPDEVIGQVRVLGQQRSVKVGSEDVPLKTSFGVVLTVVAEADPHAPEGNRLGSEEGPAAVVLETNQRRGTDVGQVGVDDDIADESPLAGLGADVDHADAGKALAIARKLGWHYDIMSTSFFLSRRSLRPAAQSGMPRWQDRLFIRLAKTANDATDYFQIPTGRVVEVGTQVTI